MGQGQGPAAHLGLAEVSRGQPARAVAILEDAIQIAPERAYLAFDALLADRPDLLSPGERARSRRRWMRRKRAG